MPTREKQRINVCKLVLYREDGVYPIWDEIDFMAHPFSQPLDLRIPPPPLREEWSEPSPFKDSAELRYSRFDNAEVTIRPTMAACGADELEKFGNKLRWFLMHAKDFADGPYRRGPRVRLLEDSKGFTCVSEILSGEVVPGADWTSIKTQQGMIQPTIRLVRRPFRHREFDERLWNLCPNPSFLHYSDWPYLWYMDDEGFQ